MFKIIILFLISQLAMADSVKIISLHYKNPEELRQVIMPMVDSKTIINSYQNQLIVKANTADLAVIAELVEKLDIKPKELILYVLRGNYAVDKDILTTISTNKDNDVYKLRVESGKTAFISDKVKNLVVMDSSALAANYNKTSATVEEYKQDSVTNTNTEENTFSGQPALPQVPQVPQPLSDISSSKNHTSNTNSNTTFTGQDNSIASNKTEAFSLHQEYQTLEQGLLVQANLVGDKVRLNITPRYSSQDVDHNIKQQTANTSLEVELGKWVEIYRVDNIVPTDATVITSEQKNGIWVKVETI